MSRWPCDRVRWRVVTGGGQREYRYRWLAWVVAYCLTLFGAVSVSLVKVIGRDGRALGGHR